MYCLYVGVLWVQLCSSCKQSLYYIQAYKDSALSLTKVRVFGLLESFDKKTEWRVLTESMQLAVSLKRKWFPTQWLLGEAFSQMRLKRGRIGQNDQETCFETSNIEYFFSYLFILSFFSSRNFLVACSLSNIYLIVFLKPLLVQLFCLLCMGLCGFLCLGRLSEVKGQLEGFSSFNLPHRFHELIAICQACWQVSLVAEPSHQAPHNSLSLLWQNAMNKNGHYIFQDQKTQDLSVYLKRAHSVLWAKRASCVLTGLEEMWGLCEASFLCHKFLVPKNACSHL